MSKKFKYSDKKNNFIDGEFEDIEDDNDKKYKVLGKFIKDMSSETKDVETYLFVKDRITKYKLDIISSVALKNKIIAKHNTKLWGQRRSSRNLFEITFQHIRVEDKIEKKELERIIYVMFKKKFDLN